jgi:uncharacterized protein YcaQ
LLQNLVEELGFVQIDTINVIERAHHLTLQTRLDSYKHHQLAHLLENERTLFEHWTHDASAIPTKWFSHWKPRFERFREKLRRNKWWQERIGKQPDKVIDQVRLRIATEGAVRSSDFEQKTAKNSSAWWGWKPEKAALEYLWSTGELMVVKREGFQKIYDLTERILPNLHKLSTPIAAEHLEWACSTALERLVVATPRELAAFWDAISLAQANEWCAESQAMGRIVPVLVASHGTERPRPAFAASNWRERLEALPPPPDRIRLLCPFDPVVRDRARLNRLFGFEYRFEAFVPDVKRKYGYFVMPIMEGDHLIGRLDPKFDRAKGELLIKRVDLEPGVKLTATRKRKLDEALYRLAKFIGAEKVTGLKNGVS